MAQRGIREYDAKQMLARYLGEFSEGRFSYPGKVVLIDPETVIDLLPREHPWLESDRLVVKPDKLFGKRAKQGLILLDASFDRTKTWIRERMNQKVTLGKVEGTLTHFLVEPFIPHEEEHYLAIKSERDGDRIHFSMFGGVFIEENWDKVRDLLVPIDMPIEDEQDAYVGRTVADAPDVDPVVYVTGEGLAAGQIGPSEIVAPRNYDLVAAAVGPPR